MTRRLVCAALAVTLMLGPAACGFAGGSARPSPSATQDRIQRELAVARRFSSCARAHGHPEFPDPVIQRNRVTYPFSGGNSGGIALKQTIGALESVPECKVILTELQAVSPPRRPNATAQVMQRLRQLADCLRHHGVPSFPDPKSDGTFPVSGTSLGDPKGSPSIKAALDACRQFADKSGTAGGFS